MRKTKVICTIGPASEDEATLTRMIKAGMNVARLNMSHGDQEEHRGRIETLKRLRKQMGIPLSIMSAAARASTCPAPSWACPL